MTILDNKVLAEISHKNPTSEAFFTYAACRERNVRDGVTRLTALKTQLAREGFAPVSQDLMSMFKELERAGVGLLKGDFFEWHVPINKLGEVSLRLPNQTHNIHTPLPTKNLVIVFADKKEASVTFTPNLTREDVKFLAEKLLNGCG